MGYSWKTTVLSKQRNLTGFAHGTAGVGYALLELFHVTNDSKYRIAAEQAFNYERYWFDNATGNWPDFRKVQGRGKRRSTSSSLSFATYWCHGAPGITLSRLRAYELLKDEICKAEARTALRTTRKAIETALQFERGNFSLCHGLAGNTEVLLYSYQVLGQEEVSNLMLAYEVADRGIKTSAMRRHSWPCGVVDGGETPDLMLGLAGIGYFYLRLHNLELPSILILQPDKFPHRKTSKKSDDAFSRTSTQC
jgi:lantibiotic modifying enzyme